MIKHSSVYYLYVPVYIFKIDIFMTGHDHFEPEMQIITWLICCFTIIDDYFNVFMYTILSISGKQQGIFYNLFLCYIQEMPVSNTLGQIFIFSWYRAVVSEDKNKI